MKHIFLIRTLVLFSLLVSPLYSFAWDFIQISEDENTRDFIYPEAIDIDEHTKAFVFLTTFDTDEKRAEMKQILRLSRLPEKFYTSICYNSSWDKCAFLMFEIKDKDNETIDKIKKDHLEWKEIKSKKDRLFRDRALQVVKLANQ